MAEPFLAEIHIFGFEFPPRGFAPCDGRILSISSNTALFSLLGTNYGGDGRTTFALPDLRGRVPVHMGDGPGLSSVMLGEKAGTELETLDVTKIPSHQHNLQQNNTNVAASNTVGTSTNDVLSDPKFETRLDNGSSSAQTMNTASIANTGGGQSHNNMQPSTTINFCIALQGLYPSRS